MLTWRLFYVFYFLYRCALSILAQVVVSSLTILGDSGSYQTAGSVFLHADGLGFLADPTEVRYLSTSLTYSIGAVLNIISGGNPHFVNFGFQCIAYFGLYRLLTALTPAFRGPVALLLLTPSFNLWTSVASKEAITAFAVAIIARYIYRIGQERQFGVGFLEVLAFLLIWIFKNQYLPSLAFLIGVSFFAQYFHQKSVVAIFAGLMTIVGLFIFQDVLADLAFRVQIHWTSLTGSNVGSTRPAFFQEAFDVILKAPLGMWLSFMGPTLGEVSRGMLHKVSFLESTFIFGVLVYYVLVRLPSIPVYSFAIGGFALFWLLFGTYPFGVMNAGSAIRYRAGYLILVILIVLFVMTRSSYLSFSAPRERR